MVTVAQPRQSTIAETRRQGRFKAYIQRHREFVSALAFLVIMLGAFTIISPGVFLRPQIYTAIFISLPISIILAVSLVFVIVGGEVDLAFPSVVGISALVFTMVVEVGANPWIGLALALAAGMLAGLCNGLLVAYLGLSSLVVTLGMNFLWRGLIQIVRQGNGAPLTFLTKTDLYQILVGRVGFVPVQLIWGLLFAALGILLFTRFRFGSQVACIGDNIEAAREMGINVRLSRH
jgi:ribose/xylose/arabinose/galactoside ABC-type transport system permease subunit